MECFVDKDEREAENESGKNLVNFLRGNIFFEPFKFFLEQDWPKFLCKSD